MFGFTKIIKSATGFNQKKAEENIEQKSEDNNTEGVLKKSSNKFSDLVGDLFSKIGEEFKVIREKSKDLSTTNYNLGMKYFEEGNLKEAIFRFKITKKFWPDNYDAYYQLAVCLMLDNKPEKSKLIADQLLEKAPQYKEKIDQLNTKIDQDENFDVKKTDPATN